MPQLQYCELERNQIPQVIYVEKPLYCWGLGNFILKTINFSVDVVLCTGIVISAIPWKILELGVYIQEKTYKWKKDKASKNIQDNSVPQPVET